QDLLDVRIEKGADLGQTLDLRWIPVIAAGRDELAAGAHREQHLGRRRNERDDARRTHRRHLRRDADWRDDEQDGERRATDQRTRRKSSHRKNGPPRTAVTIPTGSSTGARIVRAIRSHSTRNDAPKIADAGNTSL